AAPGYRSRPTGNASRAPECANPAAAGARDTAIRRSVRGVAHADADGWPRAAPVSFLPTAHRQSAPIEYPARQTGLGREFCRRLADAEFGDHNPQPCVDFGLFRLAAFGRADHYYSFTAGRPGETVMGGKIAQSSAPYFLVQFGQL